MALYSPVYNLWKLARQFFGRPLSTSGRVFNLSTPEVYAEIDQEKAIERGFNANTAVYSIVSKDIKKFASLPRYLYSKQKKEMKAFGPKWLQEIKAAQKIEDGGKLLSLLQRPNQYQGQDAFFATVRAYYKICGEAFIWLNRGDISEYRFEDGSFDDVAINRLPVIEMIPLPSNLITIVPDPENLWGVEGYLLEVGERVIIRKDDVIHWKTVSLDFDAASRTHLRGMPPLKPGARTLEENNSMTNAAMRQAQNNGAAGVLYNKTLDKMTPENQTRLKKVIDSKINNNDVAGAVATLQGDWGYLDFGKSSKDMQLIEGQKFSWQELCFLFGVPVELFDPATTFANKEMAQVSWVINEIMPDCKQLDDEMNRMLLKAFKMESVAYIGTDYTQLPEIQKTITETAKIMQEIWCIAPDDIRDFLGYERLGGDFDEPWVAAGRTPLSKAHMDDGGNDILNQIDNGRNRAGGDEDVSEDAARA